MGILGLGVWKGVEMGVEEYGVLTDVSRGSTKSQDLACHGVVHDRVTAHAICIARSATSCGLRSCPIGAIPVHGHSWAGLEDRTPLPAKEPAVVVASVDMAKAHICHDLALG